MMGITDAANALCFFMAMQHTTVAVAVLAHYLTPVLVAVTAPFILGERLRPGTLLALLGATTGLVLLLRPWGALDASQLLGAGLGVLSAVFYAASLLIAKGLFRHLTPVAVAAWPKMVSVPLLVGAAWAISGGLDVELKPMVILIVGACVCGVVPTLLFNGGLRRLRASQASVLTLVEPLVAVAVGVFVWREQLHPLSVVGGVCILLGAWTIARASASPSASPSPPAPVAT